MVSYYDYMYRRYLSSQQPFLNQVRSRYSDQFMQEFTSKLGSASDELTGSFDTFFEADTANRNQFIDSLRQQIELGNRSAETIQRSQRSLVDLIRSGEVNRSNIASRAEISEMRRSLKNLRNIDLQEDTAETKVVDLFGNEVLLSELDLNQRTGRRYQPETTTEPIDYSMIEEQLNKYNQDRSEDIRHAWAGTLQIRRLLDKYGFRDAETIARLDALYGDTDISLAGVSNEDLDQFLNVREDAQSQTYEQLNLALDELERDELQRRYNLGMLREQQRIAKNEEIRQAREVFGNRAAELGQTLERLGLTSEQLQARDEISAEGGGVDPRQQIVTASKGPSGIVPVFPQRPM